MIEFRLTDFIIDPYAMIGIADGLTMNPNLMMIDFSRNNINEDIAGAVIQRLYYNPLLTKINFDGNPISVGLFTEQVIKPYFSTRKELKIILA